MGDRKEEMGIGIARLLSAWNGRGERPVCCLKRVCGRARECNSNPCSSKICADLYVQHAHAQSRRPCATVAPFNQFTRMLNLLNPRIPRVLCNKWKKGVRKRARNAKKREVISLQIAGDCDKIHHINRNLDFRCTL